MRIDALIAAAQVLELNNSKIASNANVGDILHVQVVSSSKNEAVLKMPDGKIINVGSMVDLNHIIGEYLDLVVSDKKDGKIFLETLKNSEIAGKGTSLSTEQIKSLLTSLKLSVNAKNIEIIQEMTQRQMPVNKDSMLSILNNLANNPTLNVQKAVFMSANGINVEEKNINMLNQYADSKIVLGNQLKEITNLIDKIDDNETLKNILNKLSLVQDKNFAKSLDETAAAVAKQIISENQSENTVMTNINGNTPSNTSSSSSNSLIYINQQNAQQAINKEILPLIKNLILENIDGQMEQKLSAQQSLNLQTDAEKIKQTVSELNEDKVLDIFNKMPDSDKAKVEKLLIRNINNDLEPNLNDTSGIYDDSNNRLKSEIKRIFEKHFIKNTSENLAEDLHLNDSYKDILVKLDVVKEAISAKGNSDQLMNTITQTEDNIKFMNNLSQYNTFVQIPLNIWGQNTNGELYVLKKSRKKIDPNSASVFLSLDMPNMGLTEVLVTVSARNVGCNFRLKNEKVIALVRKNASKLSEAIAKLGYNSVDIGCGLIREKTNLLDMNKVTSEASFTNKLAFDARI